MKNRTRAIDKVFWAAYARYWDNPDQAAIARQRVEDVVARLAARGAETGQRVLDAGCGTGLFTLALAQAGYRVTGVDFAPGVLERAGRKAEELNLSAEFEKIDLDKPFWFADNYFHHAICSTTLHLVGQPGRTLSELRRVLKPGGYIIATVWLDPAQHRTAFAEALSKPPQTLTGKLPGIRERAWLTVRALGERARRHYWTEQEFRELLVKQGFEVLELDSGPLLTAVARKKPDVS